MFHIHPINTFYNALLDLTLKTRTVGNESWKIGQTAVQVYIDIFRTGTNFHTYALAESLCNLWYQARGCHHIHLSCCLKIQQLGNEFCSAAIHMLAFIKGIYNHKSPRIRVCHRAQSFSYFVCRRSSSFLDALVI